jgi:hypothetical protein
MKSEQKIEELEKQIEELKQELKKDSKHEEMEQWFKSLLNGLEIEINDKYTNEVFYKKNGNIFFELYQGSEKTYFLCNFYLVWSVFEFKYDLNNDEIQLFINSMVEKYLKFGGATPNVFYF